VPFRIQRVARGLGDVLSIFGGQAPSELEDRVRATLDLLQFYGLTQRQQFSNSGVTAEGANLSIVLPNSWCVLFAASVSCATTAALTIAGIGVSIQRGTGNAQQPVSYSLYNITVGAGGALLDTFVPPYPLLLPPGSVISGIPHQLIGEGNVTLQVQCDVGVLG
jgi:hypothetical protein